MRSSQLAPRLSKIGFLNLIDQEVCVSIGNTHFLFFCLFVMPFHPTIRKMETAGDPEQQKISKRCKTNHAEHNWYRCTDVNTKQAKGEQRGLSAANGAKQGCDDVGELDSKRNMASKTLEAEDKI